MESNQEPESQFATAAGMRIHYQVVGTGPPLICLHGGGPGASSWSNFAPNVPDLSQRHELYLIDMPGFGKSEKVAIESPSLTRVAAIVAELADQLGITSAGLLGNSRGGQVGLKLAIDRPDVVRRLAVIGSMPGMPSALTPMPPEAVAMIRNYYRDDGPSPQKIRNLMEVMVYDKSLITEDRVRARYEASIEPELLELGGTLPAPQNLVHELSDVPCPTLIIWGQDDRAGPLDVGLMMLRLIPDARMHVFGRCGHWAQLEHSKEFNALVLEFFGSTDGVS